MFVHEFACFLMCFREVDNQVEEYSDFVWLIKKNFVIKN